MKTSPPELAATSRSKLTRLSEEEKEEAEDREEDPEEKEEREESANPESVDNKRKLRKELLRPRLTLLSKKRLRLKIRPLPSVKAEEEELVKVNSDVLF